MLKEVKKKLAQMPLKDRIALLKAKKNVDNLVKKTREELANEPIDFE